MATILLVEDDMLLAECYARWLQAGGHTAVHVTGAQAALDALDEAIPDVIILDMLLHGATGVQLLHTVRSYSDFAAIPIVVCSNALPAKIPDMSAYGVKRVVDKTTLTRRRLRDIIAEVL